MLITNYSVFACLTISALFHYVAPGLAYLLFSQVGTMGMALIRNLSSALVLLFLLFTFKRKVFSKDRATLSSALYLGASLAIMNISFYKAIDRLSLSTVAAIEFLAPVLLTVCATKKPINFIAIVLSVLGVNFLFKGQYQTNIEGIFWAIANAISFGLYISIVKNISLSRKMPDIHLLTMSFCFSSLIILPFSIGDLSKVEVSLWLILVCIAIGLASSLIPYLLDQLILQRLPRESISIYLSILPFVAALVGAVVLYQIPTPLEIAGLALIALAIFLHKPTYDS